MKTSIIRVYGIVQGVGFRPFVSRTCLNNSIRGTVSNKGSYVEIHAQGENVPVLLEALRKDPPKRSVILEVIRRYEEEDPYDTFEIIESERDTGEIFVSPDIAICEDCKKELYTPTDRRYLHPFINCTNCGPRLTILNSMPYDRIRTSMGEFPMCPECRTEYTSPASRRYDAQPVCCNECGPEVYILNGMEHRRDAIIAARKTLIEGRIVAVKGIGGFHLACDATNEEAVKRLRILKSRPMKPFAVMLRSIETCRKYCEILKEQEEYLTGHQKPIVLLKKKQRSDTGENIPLLADSLAPSNPTLGIMLPYAPIQLLLFDYDDGLSMPDALVMTSGNASGAPICRTDEDALSEIAHYTDLILSNNRTIRLRCDDTVTDFFEGKPYMIRRSRGFAPLPFMISGKRKGSVLGIGGELKNTFCIAKDNLLYPSAYIGDMEDIRSVEALKQSVTRMETLLETSPTAVVCDLHPKYHTTEVAETLGLPVYKIQHHYAHILSCMAENNYLDPVIGVSFDGTGYGTDGTIWGGEVLKCNLHGFERLSHISPFLQSGGDLSAKEGWRIAVSILRDPTDKGSADEAYDPGREYAARLHLCTPVEYDMVRNMAERGINTVTSTSAGRIFDAASALLGIRKCSTFEGEASTALMFAAEQYLEETSGDALLRDIPLLSDDELLTAENNADTNTLIVRLAERMLEGEDRNRLAYAFHKTLSEMILRQCLFANKKTGIKTVALSGGVFQNILLLTLTKKGLTERGFTVLHHSLIPPNDGGISLGQALYGLYNI